MDNVQELREKTNPVFNTAKATLLHLTQAGHADAAMMAEKLGLDLAAVTHSDEEKTAMGQSNVAIVELRYRSMNAFIQASGAKTVVDLPCGYTPRALEDFIADKRYIACDLPAVAEEMGPLVDEILAGRGWKRDVAYQGVDATNYASLRAALEGAEGPLCITTEGLLMYLTQPELAALMDNIRRILEEFGGVWITQDPEVGRVYIAMTVVSMSSDPAAAKAAMDALGGGADMGTALKGIKAQSALGASMNTFGGEADVDFSKAMNYRPEQAEAAEKDLLHAHGLKVELTPVAERMPRLGSLDPERTELARQAMERINLWTITPDKTTLLHVTDGGGDGFGVSIRARGGVMDVVLRGRVDSITAPEFLVAYEKAAGSMDLTDVHVDMSELAYISSAGLRVLLMMIKAVQPGHVSVSGVNETVRDILTQTGYADMVTMAGEEG